MYIPFKMSDSVMQLKENKSEMAPESLKSGNGMTTDLTGTLQK